MHHVVVVEFNFFLCFGFSLLDVIDLAKLTSSLERIKRYGGEWLCLGGGGIGGGGTGGILRVQGVPEITYQKENCIYPSYYDQMSWFFFWW